MGASHRRHGRSFLLRAVRKTGFSRREFLRRAGLASAGLAGHALLTACGNSGEGPGPASVTATAPVGTSPVTAPVGKVLFLHGVASGDPLTDRVILWTRATPDVAASSVAVDWLIATDTSLKNVVQTGRFTTHAARDYTVKVDVTQLKSYTTFYYQFSSVQADGSTVKSPIGRTRTAPKAGDTDRLRFVSASCQNYTDGYFNSHAAIATKKDDPTQYHPVTGAGSLALEFSNNAIANVGIIGENFQANNPHLKYDSLGTCGYLLLDITAARVQGEYFFTPAPQVRSATETFMRALINNDKANLLTLGTTATTERPTAPALAP